MVAKIKGNVLHDQLVSEVMLPPEDRLMVRIFLSAIEGSPQDFLKINLVSKEWRRIVTGKEFDQKLRKCIAPKVFGRADFIKYIGGDPGNELPIPFEYLVRFKSGRTLLTFSPKSLTFPKGVEHCTLPNMGKWASTAKGCYQIGYHGDTWQNIMQHPWDIKEAHWSFLDTDLTGFHQDYAGQIQFAQALGGAVSELLDTTLSLLMAYVKTGGQYINLGEEDSLPRWARVQEVLDTWNVVVSFAIGGLVLTRHFADASPAMGIVVARSSYCRDAHQIMQ